MSISHKTKSTNHFDVIINGSGMVGATLASLLGQAGRKVAVIEASKPLSKSKNL